MDPNATNAATMNGSERPPVPGFNRTRSAEVDAAAFRHSSRAATQQREQLARGWSTAHIIQGDGQTSRHSTNTGNASAEFGGSWSSGFGGGGGGDGPDASMAWGQASWINNEMPTRVSSVSTMGGSSTNHLGPLQGPAHRSASEGMTPPTRASALLHPSAMHDAARLMDWDKVLLICQQNPTSAGFVGHQGFTALHHLCSRRCPRADVAEAVIKAFPDALVLVESNKEWTPLHFASRFKCNKQVVYKLLNLFPELGRRAVSKVDKQRRTPLWHAVRYDAPTGVVPQLLEVDPSVILRGGLESPLQEIWDKYAERMEGRRALLPFVGDQDNERASPEELRERLERSSELLDKWKRANIFLKAAFGYPLDENNAFAHAEDRRWRILHVTAAARCHPTLFQMARALYPEQARELDDNDIYFVAGETETKHQTALHLAASSDSTGTHGRAVISELLRMYPEAAHFADQIDGSYPLHRIAENKHKQHWTFDGVNAIYMANVRAVEQADSRGRLPLHRAAKAVAARQRQQENNNNNDGDGGGAPAADARTRSVILNLLEVAPQAATTRDNDGRTPFHVLAMNCGDWTDEVEAVHAANTRAMTLRAGRAFHNSLPIHLASANPKATRSCIERMVELNPRGVSQADGQGRLPLHLACEQGKDWEEGGLDIIHNAFAQAVRTPEENERRWTALHMAAASSRRCGPLIHKLVELYPEACGIQDSEGRFPFHLACEAGKTWEQGLSALFVGFPPAIATVDNEGRLPLYIVANQYAHAAIARANNDDETNHDAKESDELDVMYNLVRSDPTTIPEAS